jgi:hypothetical protein
VEQADGVSQQICHSSSLFLPNDNLDSVGFVALKIFPDDKRNIHYLNGITCDARFNQHSISGYKITKHNKNKANFTLESICSIEYSTSCVGNITQ